ncbi:hypothetical protein [Pseudarthrobacter enclensis]|uniref:hypothetical protein n=1 Tax=Pseudarthrobacter enclensis TaxID=993070 RepID=UPI00130DD62C|nr:hypothetical protein [Pseudarthrobacter enclensis]
MAIAAVSILPSMTLTSPDVRLSFLLQIVLNAFTMVVALSVFRQLPLSALRRLTVVVSWTLLTASLVQLVLVPGLNPRGETTFGLPHPILFFNEETWLAMFASLLCAASLGVGARRTGLFLAILVFFIGTRSAMIVCGCAMLMSFESIAERKWIRVLCIAVPAAFSAWFVFDAVFATGDRIYNDSLDTRTGDISAVRQANNDHFLPFGGDVLSVFDFSRSRQVPSTSNVQGFELYWKFGLGGLLIVATFAFLVAWLLPKTVLKDPSVPVWPIWVSLMIWPAMLQFNNAFGFSWMWILLALCLACMGTLNSENGGSGGLRSRMSSFEASNRVRSSRSTSRRYR